MAGSTATGRHGAGAVTELTSHPQPGGRESEQTGNGVGFGDLKVSTPATHLQEGHTSNPSQTVHQLATKCSNTRASGAILI